MGFFAWIVVPLSVVLLTVPDFIKVLLNCQLSDLGWTFFFGLLWGIGATTFGLTMRYLGMALGMSICLGFCAIFGTLMPPIFRGHFTSIYTSTSGQVILLGLMICTLGIVLCGYAGWLKESSKKLNKKELVGSQMCFAKGLIVALLSGLASACFAFGLEAAHSISETASSFGTIDLFQNNLSLMVLLWGGFTTNSLWCIFLIYKNKSLSTFEVKTPTLFRNLIYCALAGGIWYSQFFLYGMGTTYLGKAYEFSSWTLHMAFIIIFGNIWGMVFREWSKSGPKAHRFLTLGTLTLIGSTIIVGLANLM